MGSRVYARIDGVFVVEIIETAHDIREQFHPDFVSSLIDVTDADPRPDVGWGYVDETFRAPPDAAK